MVIVSDLLSPSFPFLTVDFADVLALTGDLFFPWPMKWLNSSVCFRRKSNLKQVEIRKTSGSGWQDLFWVPDFSCPWAGVEVPLEVLLPPSASILAMVTIFWLQLFNSGKCLCSSQKYFLWFYTNSIIYYFILNYIIWDCTHVRLWVC